MEWLIRADGDVESLPGYSCKKSDRKPGHANYYFGISFIAYGVVAEIVYTIVLIVMIRKEHRRLSCYKIMIVLGLYDMAALALNSILSGYFWIVGANYCYSPRLIFITGSMALGLWCGACMNCFVLVINRLMDVWNKRIMQMVFKDYRTYLVLLIPTCYGLFFASFTPPVLFNSDHMAWFFATFAPDTNVKQYYNYPHTANNLFIVVMTCALYVKYSQELLRNLKLSTGLTWAQKSFFIQSSLICMANLVASLIYVYMQFFHTPAYLVLVGHICWQLGHGFPAFVYIFLNRTIQREVLQLLGLRKRRQAVTPKFIATSRAPGTE